MELTLSPDLQARLSRVAAERGRDEKTIAYEAIERYLDYDAWFLREVDQGLAEADRGDLIEHQDAMKLILRQHPG